MDRDTSLYRALTEYCQTDAYPFHMPGHKRRLGSLADPFTFDITEIEGFDDLHHARGILLEAQERAARLYGAGRTWFLVNGSTAGILSAISASCPRGGHLLMARNSHRSAYHAVYLNELSAGYLWPEAFVPSGNRNRDPEEDYSFVNGRIRPEEVRDYLQSHPQTGAVFITSPTYDGVVSDISRIARIVHRFGIPLIVDEAHGAHFGFHPAFPESALAGGADLVIQSLHKTLPSLTQTALLHASPDCLADTARLERMLRIYQTSSPSYVLMASIDECIRLMEREGKERMEAYADALERFYLSVKELRVLSLVPADDPSRIVVSGRKAGLSGVAICAMLRKKYHLETEMAGSCYALALSSVGDDEEGLVRLSRALSEIDRELFLNKAFPGRDSWIRAYLPGDGVSDEEKRAGNRSSSFCPEEGARPDPAALRISEAWDAPRRAVPFKEAAGYVSGELVYLYPPGIPQLVPGERITGQALDFLQSCLEEGYVLSGMEDVTEKTLMVLNEEGETNAGIPL